MKQLAQLPSSSPRPEPQRQGVNLRRTARASRASARALRRSSRVGAGGAGGASSNRASWRGSEALIVAMALIFPWFRGCYPPGVQLVVEYRAYPVPGGRLQGCRPDLRGFGAVSTPIENRNFPCQTVPSRRSALRCRAVKPGLEPRNRPEDRRVGGECQQIVARPWPGSPLRGFSGLGHGRRAFSPARALGAICGRNSSSVSSCQ